MAKSAPAPRIAIRNWGSFQHYKERTPPWIKMHRSLLNNKEWHALSGDACKLLAECWLLASEYDDGVIPMGTADLAWRLRRPDSQQVARLLQELATQRFVELLEHDASTLLAPCVQDACLETEAERETEAEVPSLHDGALSKVEAVEEQPKTHKQWKDIAAGSIRTLWRAKTPPPALLAAKGYANWDMGRELTVWEQWVKQYGEQDATEAIAILPDVDEREADLPRSLAYYNKRGETDYLNLAIATVRRRREHAQSRADHTFNNVLSLLARSA